MIRFRLGLVGLLAATLVPAGVSAQSLLSAGGLGVPVDPFDARARALGGVSTGLFGTSVSPTDPAAAAGLVVPSATFTLSNSWVQVREAEARGDAAGARFPAFGVSYPVKSWGTATLTYGGVLDQRWQSTRSTTLLLGTTSTRVTDHFVSDGGISALRLGFARRLSPNVSVGGSVGTYTGDLTRNLTRTFDSLDLGLEIGSSEVGGFWGYSGYTASLGARVDVGSALRIGTSVSWSGDLQAEPSEDTDGAGATYDLPLEFRAGASGVVTPGLVASLGVTYADWSAAGASLTDGSGSGALTVGGGLEWTRVQLLGRPSPFQLGYRRSTLPFTFGSEEATETAFTAGLGLDLVRNGEVTLAGAAFSLERGSREASSLSERFTRFSFTLRVAGF